MIRYEVELPDEARAVALDLHDWLLGGSLEERAEVMLSTSIWHLHTDGDTIQDTPPLLTELADQIASATDPLTLVLSVGRNVENQESRFQLLRLIAQRVSSETLGHAALHADPQDWTALSAALSDADEQGERAWATSVLREVADGETAERLPELLVRFASLSPERIELALQVVDAGRASAQALGQLLYGARVVHLPEDLALRVVRAVAASDRTEDAMGMLDQWIERRTERSQELVDVASSLAEAAVRSGGGMVDHYLGRLLRSDVLPGDAMVSLWEERMVHRSGLADQLDRQLTDRALAADPDRVSQRIIELVRRQVAGEGTFGLYASGDLGLLSRAAQVSSPDDVWRLLRDLPGWRPSAGVNDDGRRFLRRATNSRKDLHPCRSEYRPRRACVPTSMSCSVRIASCPRSSRTSPGSACA